jgi:hypothetical protein
MSDLIRDIGSRGSVLANAYRQQSSWTTGKATDEVKSDHPAADGPLSISREAVKQALAGSGFLGSNVAHGGCLRGFGSAAGEGGSPDVSATINYVRAALIEHGFYDRTCSDTDAMRIFMVSEEQQTDETAAATNSSTGLEAARNVTAQAASQIHEQPRTAEEAQAHVFGGDAVTLLANRQVPSHGAPSDPESDASHSESSGGTALETMGDSQAVSGTAC